MHQPEIQLTIGAEGDAERRRRDTIRGVRPGASSPGKILKSRAWEIRFPEFLEQYLTQNNA